MVRKKKVLVKKWTGSLTLYSTGDFWIDNGIVGMMRQMQLQKINDNGISVEPTRITPDCSFIVLRGTREAVSGMLSKLKDALCEIGGPYIIETNNDGWYYDLNKRQPETYRKRDFRLHLKSFFGQLTGMPEDGKKSRPISSLPANERESIERFLSNHPLLKTYGVPKDKGDAGESSLGKFYTSKLAPKLEWKPLIDPGSDICSFSGEGFETALDVKGYYYPLLVDKQKMETFYSGHKVATRIGSPYALASLHAPMMAYYTRIDQNEWIYLFPDAPTLGLIEEAHQMFSMVRIDSAQKAIFCNFRATKPRIITHYPNETILCFLVSIFMHTKDDLDELGRFPEEISEEIKVPDTGIEDQNVAQIELSPTIVEDWKSMITKEELVRRMVENMGGLGLVLLRISESTKEIVRFPLIGDVFDLLFKIHKSGGKIVNFLRSFERENLGKKSQRSLPREELAKRFLRLEPMMAIVEDFLFEREANRWGPIPSCDEIINVYAKEVEGMDELILSVCKEQGGIIGAKAYDSRNMGPLYDLRNSKTMDQFIKSLEQVPFELGVSVQEELLKIAEKENWARIKSLVVIYAMNTYLKAQYKKSAESKE